jgi:uncharacterized protein YbbC (DUF1343 family)
MQIQTGLDRFSETEWKRFKGCRLGLLANPASVDSRLTPAARVISSCLPGHLKALFGPQHGYGGEEQDNMEETSHSHDRDLNIPVFSLYGETREPLASMLEALDILLIDLQDVGTRVYTFASTVLNCIKGAAAHGKRVVVLDRPNPLGGEIVEGNVLHPDWFSFVGPYPLPMRHGLTMGELARLFHDAFQLDCDLEVISMTGWRRAMLWHETGRRWIPPSPNMPLAETAWVYPGQVMLEGTNLSEGRGTCRPFEIFGAPYLDTRAVLQRIRDEAPPGCLFQEYTFRPTFHKWEKQLCNGFLMHLLDPHAFRPCRTTTLVLTLVQDLCEENFRWREPPYEYEDKKKPIDVIMGGDSFRQDVKAGVSAAELDRQWHAEHRSFLERRRPCLLYV